MGAKDVAVRAVRTTKKFQKKNPTKKRDESINFNKNLKEKANSDAK